MNKKTILRTAVFAVFMVAIAVSYSINITSTHAANTVAEVQAQIAALQAQLLALGGETPSNSTACTFTRSLYFGITGDDVRCLQQYLNIAGFTLAESGPGSLGNETTFFGPLTQNAVSRWQSSKGVLPTAGFFGPISRAKYLTVFATTPAPVPTPSPIGGALVTITQASNQPASTLIPQNAARVPFTKVQFIAGPDHDAVIRSVTIELNGFTNTSAFDRIMLLDENKLQIGNSRSFNANRQAIFTEQFTIPMGQTRTITVAADSASNLSSYQGQTARIAVVAVEAYSPEQGVFQVPIDTQIMGNDMTFNSTLTIGTLNATRGTTDPGNTQNKEVGGNDSTFAAVRVTAGSQEDVSLEGIRWTQFGSAAPSDITDVHVLVDGISHPTTLSSDGKTYTALFGSGITLSKGGVKEISIVGDIVSGPNRTVNFDILKRTDVIARGKVFGYYITTTGGTSGAASEGNFSSDQEPFYNGYALTVAQGSLIAERSNAVTAGNIAVDVMDAGLGAFSFEARGEAIQVTRLVLTLTVTGSGSASNISNIRIYDENGALVAGPKDASGSTVTFTDSWTIHSGKHIYTVRGKLSTAFATSDTVIVSFNPASDITARGETTGNTITAAPNSSISANKQTIQSNALTVSVSTSPSPQTIVAGVSGFTFARYVLDASASGENVRVTTLTLRDTYAGAGATNLSNCRLMDGPTVLNTGGNNVNPSLDGTSPDDFTFHMDSPLIVPKGTVKTVDLACNVSGSANTSSTHAWGINSGSSNVVVAYGATSGATVSPSVVTSVGQTMTIASGGSISVTLDSSSPSQRYGIAGSADILLTILKIEAQNETMRLNKIGLVLSTATASLADIGRVTLWDGVTKIGEGIVTASNGKVTINLSSPLIIPKDTTKLLTIHTDLATLGANQPGTSGHLIAVNYNGVDATVTEAVGEASGTTVSPAVTSNTAAGGVRLVKTYPSFELISIPSNTLNNGTQILYRFKIIANSTNDVGLYKFTFLRTVSGVTLSDYFVYGYTDSGFSNQAYAYNSVNRTAASADGSGYIEVYFDPVSGAGNEAIQIPKGETRYFELVASVSGAGSGDSATITLLGDAAYYASGYSGTATAIDADTNDNFIWSPNTSSTATPSSSDWLNGFRLPGLPSTGLTIQTLSR